MTLTEQVNKRIIKKLLKGEDYRIEIISLINADFLEFAIDFFKQIVEAKLRNDNINADWYEEAFLNPKLPKEQIAINSGLNMKTISNMYETTRKEVVIDAAKGHYEVLYNSIKELTEYEEDIDFTLTIKLGRVGVDLNISETLIVINTLAVKRAAIRGGLWSTAGKQVEKPLMLTLCNLFSVPAANYQEQTGAKKITDMFHREVDFYLLRGEKKLKCEVKLMGRGNPESADAVIARSSDVFIADKLSDTNKSQLDSLQVEWVELRCEDGFRKFKTVLENLDIPHSDYQGTDLDQDLEQIFKRVFS